VAAFGLDERTVSAWLQRAGAHCARLHGHLVEAGQVAGGQVQADEIRVKVRGGVVWQAMALDVASRLWLGGVVGQVRDGALVTPLLEGSVRTQNTGCSSLTMCARTTAKNGSISRVILRFRPLPFCFAGLSSES